MTLAAVETDRERIRQITSLPEAAAQPQAALAVALAGASVDEARAALSITSELNGGGPDQQASQDKLGGNSQAEKLILALVDARHAANNANELVQFLRSSYADAVCDRDDLASARAKRALAAAREELADQTEKEAMLEEELAALGVRRLPLDAPTLARFFGSVPQRLRFNSSAEAP